MVGFPSSSRIDGEASTRIGFVFVAIDAPGCAQSHAHQAVEAFSQLASICTFTAMPRRNVRQSSDTGGRHGRQVTYFQNDRHKSGLYPFAATPQPHAMEPGPKGNGRPAATRQRRHDSELASISRDLLVLITEVLVVYEFMHFTVGFVLYLFLRRLARLATEG